MTIDIIKSSILTHQTNPYRLPLPSKRFDVRRIMASSIPAFETIEDSREEDRYRATQLEKQGDSAGKVLAAMLHRATNNKAHLLSCASHFHMRQARIRFSGEVMKLAVEAHDAGEQVLAFTLLPTMWRSETLSWEHQHTRPRKDQVRRWLERSGVSKASGFVYAGFHGEWDGHYFLEHLHGIGVGEKGKLLCNLSGRFGLVPDSSIRAPLQIVKIPINRNLDDLALWTTYCLQSWWPSRPLFIDAQGNERRARQKMRLPVPQHVEFLNFMARHSVGDLLFLNGIKLEKGHLVRM